MNQTKPIEKDGATSALRLRERLRRGTRHIAELGHSKISEKLGEPRMKQYRVEARRRSMRIWLAMRDWIKSDRNLIAKAIYAFIGLFTLFLLLAGLAFNLQIPDADSRIDILARPDGPPDYWSILADSLSFIVGMPIALAGSIVAIWLAVLAHRAATDTHVLAERQQALAERQDQREADQQALEEALPGIQMAAQDIKNYRDALSGLEMRLLDMARVALSAPDGDRYPAEASIQAARDKLADALRETAAALEYALDNPLLASAFEENERLRNTALRRYEILFDARRDANIEALQTSWEEYEAHGEPEDYDDQYRKDRLVWGINRDPFSLVKTLNEAADATNSVDIKETIARIRAGRYNLWIANKTKFHTRTNETNLQNDPFTLEKRLPHPQAYGKPDIDFLHLQVKPEAFGAPKAKGSALRSLRRAMAAKGRRRRQAADFDPNLALAHSRISNADLAAGAPEPLPVRSGPPLGTRADRIAVYTSDDVVFSNPDIRELPPHRHLLFAMGVVVDPMGPALPPIVTKDWQYVDPHPEGDTAEDKATRDRNETAKKITGVYRDHLYWCVAHQYQDVFGSAPRQKAKGRNEGSETKKAIPDESNWEMDDRPSKQELEDMVDDGYMLVSHPWHANRILNDVAARHRRMTERMNDTISRDKTFFNRGGYILISLLELLPDIEDLVRATCKKYEIHYLDPVATKQNPSKTTVVRRIRNDWNSRQRYWKPPQGLEYLRKSELPRNGEPSRFGEQHALFQSIPVRARKDYSFPQSLEPVASLRDELSDELRDSTTATIEEPEAV